MCPGVFRARSWALGGSARGGEACPGPGKPQVRFSVGSLEGGGLDFWGRFLVGAPKQQPYPALFLGFVQNIPIVFGKIPAPSLLFFSLTLFFSGRGRWLREGCESLSEVWRRRRLPFSSASSWKISELFGIVLRSEKPVLSTGKPKCPGVIRSSLRSESREGPGTGSQKPGFGLKAGKGLGSRQGDGSGAGRKKAKIAVGFSREA